MARKLTAAERMARIGGLVEEAEAIDRPVTMTVLASAEQALLRIVKQARAEPPWERVEIVQKRGPTLDFTGRLLAERSFTTTMGTPLEITMEIWQTEGGALVAVSSSLLVGGRGREEARATVVPPTDDVQAMRLAVMEALDWHNAARDMAAKLGWSLRMEVE